MLSVPVDARQRAIATCDRALVDYETGLLDDDELRRILGRAGVVLEDGDPWLLDVELGRWSRYAPVPPDRALDVGAVREWRARLRSLLDDPRHDTEVDPSNNEQGGT